MKRLILLASLALCSCATVDAAGFRKAAALTEEGCRAYLAAYPDGKGGVAQVCRKVVGAAAVGAVVESYP